MITFAKSCQLLHLRLNLRNYLKRKCKKQIDSLVDKIQQKKFILFSNIVTDKRDKKLEEGIIKDIKTGEKKGADIYLKALKRLLSGVRNNLFHGQKVLRKDQINVLMHSSQVLACWNYKLAQQCGIRCESLKNFYE